MKLTRVEAFNKETKLANSLQNSCEGFVLGWGQLIVVECSARLAACFLWPICMELGGKAAMPLLSFKKFHSQEMR